MVLKASLCMYDMVVCFRIPEVIACFYAKICFGMHSIFDAVKWRSYIAYLVPFHQVDLFHQLDQLDKWTRTSFQSRCFVQTDSRDLKHVSK